MNKKLMALLICLTMTIGISATAFAAGKDGNSLDVDTQEIKQQVEQLLDKRAEMLAVDDETQLEIIDNQLEALGVEHMTQTEVMEKFGNESQVMPYVSVPSSANVTWYSYTSYYMGADATYEVQSLYAQPKNSSSNLRTNQSAFLVASGGIKAGLLKMLGVIGREAASQIVILDIASSVYDLVNAYVSGVNTTTIVQDAQAMYDTTLVETVCFQYVKVKGQSDVYQSLAHISTKIDVNTEITIKTINGVNPGNPKISTGYQATPPGYANSEKAVNAYRNAGSVNSYVKNVRVTGFNDQLIISMDPLAPAFPAHVK